MPDTAGGGGGALSRGTKHNTTICANPKSIRDDLMRRFNWKTMLIFVMGLLLAVMLLGLGTAHISKLKQQHRQLSDSSAFDPVRVDPCRQRARHA